jgi:hypothetical protein
VTSVVKSVSIVDGQKGKLHINIHSDGGVQLRYNTPSNPVWSDESVLFADRAGLSAAFSQAGLKEDAQHVLMYHGELSIDIDITEELLRSLGFLQAGASLR